MSGEEHHIQYVPEPPSVGMAFVGWSALGSLLLLAAAIGGLFLVFRTTVPARVPQAPHAFPQPRVDTTESEELRRLTDAQTKTLQIWKWADSQHATVQVPIERAMQLLAKKGAGAYQPLLASPQAALSEPAAAAERTTIQQSGATPTVSGDANPQAPEPGK